MTEADPSCSLVLRAPRSRERCRARLAALAVLVSLLLGATPGFADGEGKSLPPPVVRGGPAKAPPAPAPRPSPAPTQPARVVPAAAPQDDGPAASPPASPAPAPQGGSAAAPGSACDPGASPEKQETNPFDALYFERDARRPYGPPSLWSRSGSFLPASDPNNSAFEARLWEEYRLAAQAWNRRASVAEGREPKVVVTAPPSWSAPTWSLPAPLLNFGTRDIKGPSISEADTFLSEVDPLPPLFPDETFEQWRERKILQMDYAWTFVEEAARMPYAAMTPGCIEQSPSLRAAQTEFSRRSVRVAPHPVVVTAGIDAADPGDPIRRAPWVREQSLTPDWHVRPMFDARVVDRNIYSYQAGPRATIYEATFDEVRPSVLSVFTMSRSEAKPKELPRFERIFETNQAGMTGQLSWGGSSASKSQLEKLQLGKSDPKKKLLQNTKVDFDLNADLLEMVNLNLWVNATGKEDGLADVKVPNGEVAATVKKGDTDWRLHLGIFQTPFGIENMRPRKDLYFLDSSLPQTRFLGPNGMQSDAGIGVASIGKHMRTAFGVQSATAANMDEFLSSDDKPEYSHRHGGRPYVDTAADDLFSSVAIYARVEHDGLVPRTGPLRCTRPVLGASVVYGPNATGSEGRTLLAGVHLNVLQRVENPAWMWQTEFFLRQFHADAFYDNKGTPAPADDVFLPADTLSDWGVTSAFLYAPSNRLAGGLRFDWVTGSGQEYGGLLLLPTRRSQNEWRDDHYRFSALIAFRPTLPLRFRIQYNFDDASNVGSVQHSFWAGIDVDVGKYKPKPGS